MNDKELWELMSIICEGQDSEQRREVEQYITDLQKEIERLNNIIKTKEEGFMAVVDELCETTEMLEETKKAIDEIERYFKEDYYYCNHPKTIYRNDLFKKIKYLKRKLKKN